MPRRPKPIDDQLRDAIGKAERRGITQGSIATASGVSRPVLMRFMDGSGGLRVEQAEAVAEAIGWRLSLNRAG